MAQPTAETRRPQRDSDALRLISTAVAEAAAAVTGVHHLGGTVGRSLERASRAVLGRSTAAGVNVAQEDGVTNADVDIVVEYPHPVTRVAAEVHEQVARAASALASGRVVVNVTVADIFGPGDRDRVTEVDTALTEASAKGQEAATRAGDAVKEGYARASDATRQGTTRAAELARDAAERAAEAADRAVDATRDGASRGVAVVAEGAERARTAAADAIDAVDREISARRSPAASGDDAQVTVVTESATITVDAAPAAVVAVDGDDIADADAERRDLPDTSER